MLAAVNVQKIYENGFPALQGVNISVERGEAVGLTGVSGSGKSTLARLLCCLEQCSGGRIELEGRVYNIPRRVFLNDSLKEFRRGVQIIFQDSNGSLDPRLTIRRAVAEPLDNFDPGFRRASRKQREIYIGELLERVGLDPGKMNSFPHELSGGQRQRAVIARALAVNPRYLICDEPVSSLDAESRDRIAELLLSLQKETGMGCLFISHDPILTSRMSGRICVMEEGRITETFLGENHA